MLVAGFALVSLLVTSLKIPPLPGWLLSAPACLLVLVPLTTIAQFYMWQSFGPDTAMGILPWPPKLSVGRCGNARTTQLYRIELPLLGTDTARGAVTTRRVSFRTPHQAPIKRRCALFFRSSA